MEIEAFVCAFDRRRRCYLVTGRCGGQSGAYSVRPCPPVPEDWFWLDLLLKIRAGPCSAEELVDFSVPRRRLVFMAHGCAMGCAFTWGIRLAEGS